MKILFALVLGLVCSTVLASDFQINKSSGQVKLLIDVERGLGSELDILFVVDDSGSMWRHQQNLANHTEVLIAELLALNIPFHAGVITTDATKDAGVLRGNPSFVTQDTPNVGRVLADNIEVGANGHFEEKVFENIVTALTPPLLDTANKGFYREDAALALIFVTDAEDQSQLSPDDLIQFTTSLKADASQVSAHGIVVPSQISNCERDDITAPPVKLESVINHFGGVIGNLCDSQSKYLNTIQSISEKLGDMVNRSVSLDPITLPLQPQYDSIQVRFGQRILPKGDLHKGWIYDSLKNQILFGQQMDLSGEPAGTQLEITFLIANWGE